jgi:beta-lactam-binding protein with PASTA domain
MRKLPFGLHIIIALALAALLLIGIIYFLDSYTKHGKTTEVPNVARKTLTQAIKELEAKGFSVDVDSTYRDSLPPFFVIKQFPAGGDRVKTGRTIQLIVNKGAPPLVAMPALLGVRVASALQYLERSNLKLGDTLFKPDFAAGRILQQLVNGAEVKPGTMLRYGTKVTLVIGSGTGAIIYNYPDFYGMTLKQAITIMDTLGLSRGAISMDQGTKDSLNAYVYKQYPEPWDPFENRPTLIRQGNTVDLFISNVRKPRAVVDTSNNYNINEQDLNNAKAEGLNAMQEEEIVDPKTGVKTKRKKPKPKPKPKPEEPAAAPAATPNKGEEY